MLYQEASQSDFHKFVIPCDANLIMIWRNVENPLTKCFVMNLNGNCDGN